MITKLRPVYPVVLASLLAFSLTLLFNTLSSQSVQAAPPFPDQRQAAAAAIKWLVETHQNPDGGYTNFSQGANLAPSDVSGTTDAILALASAGYNPAAPYPGKVNAPLGWLQTHPISLSLYAGQEGGQAAKLLLAVSAANQDPTDFVGYDLVLSLTQHYSSSGQYANTPFGQALALMALKSVSKPIPAQATHWLTQQQTLTTGGWPSFGFDDVDTTALSLMALVAAGVPTQNTTLVKGLNFLRQNQDISGGWAPFGTVSANSTALVIQALAATGQDFYSSEGIWSKTGKTPLMALLEAQNGAGAFQADFGSGPFADFYATVQAVAGVVGKPYPLKSRYQAAGRGLSCLDQLQADNGGFPSLGTAGDAAGTSRAIQAIADMGRNPLGATWVKNGINPPQALETLAPAYLDRGRGGALGIVMQGVAKGWRRGSPYTVTQFAGRNLVVSMSQKLNATTGEYDSTAFGIFAHAEAMLGLLEAGYPVDSRAVMRLLRWLDDPANINPAENNPDDMGMVLNVLGRLGIRAETAVKQAQAIQQADGSWTTFSVVNSSSEIGQGLVMSGLNPFDPTWSRVVKGQVWSAADVVMSQQEANGCWGSAYDTPDAITLLSQSPRWDRGSLVLTVTVGAGASCGTTAQLAALPGSQVTYCYTVQNLTPFTLTQHRITDNTSQNLTTTLAPFARTTLTKTVTLTTTPIQQVVYWQADNPNVPQSMVSDGQRVQVTNYPHYLPLLRK